MKLLIINPGSTSTKISIYEDEKMLYEESVFHDAPELLKYPHVNDQVPFRKQVILSFLEQNGLSLNDIDVFVGRGGSFTMIQETPKAAVNILPSWASCWRMNSAKKDIRERSQWILPMLMSFVMKQD